MSAAPATPESDRGRSTSPWSPLRIGIFRALLIAAFVSNLGTWMQMVGATWLMASLTASAALVALVQTAVALPTFVLALPSGALADILDRRWMIVATQGWMFAVAAALALVTAADLVTPEVLLALTLALGAGAALAVPVLASVTAEVVPGRELPAAISLNSAGFTLAQALGPTLGGVLVAAAGADAVFALNALSFLGVAAVAVAWRREPRHSGLPAEHVAGAVRTGLRYLRHAPPLKAVLGRLFAHAFFFSALPALLVIVARDRLELGAGGYGALLGCFGVGGALGALLVPRLRDRLAPDRLVLVAAAVFGVALVAVGTLRVDAVVFAVMVLAGVGSMAALSTFMISAQSVLPSWVRGRGLALYMLAFQAAMAAGAAAWGALAAETTVTTALVAAGVGVVVVNLGASFAGARLGAAEDVDLTPAHWSEPGFVLEPDPEDGPILIEIEYRIAGPDVARFQRAMDDVRRTRRRDGAMRWSLFQDLSDPERHVESFLVASWAEHERQPERAVKSDRVAIERALGLHQGDDGPHVRHLLGQAVRRAR